jgi:chromosome segregation ATPase
MKKQVLIFLLISQVFASFSQSTSVDTLKLINDLKVLKSQIVSKLGKLQEEMNDKQILIDSCQKKINEVNKQLASLKLKVSKKQKGTIDREEKQLKQINLELDGLNKKQFDYKAELDKGNQLIKKLDEAIQTLSNSPG